MTIDRRFEIRKAVLKKDVGEIKKITKEELLEYIEIVNSDFTFSMQLLSSRM